MKIYKNKSITDVPYFKASGISCGIKKNKKDICVIYSEKEAVSAATFTNNKVKAAPVLLSMDHIKNKNTQAIIVNSGNANACTGDTGFNNAYAMTEKTAQCLSLKPKEVLVASTGIIGVPLPIDIVIPGIEKSCAQLSYDGSEDAGDAILTTDTFKKKITVETIIDGKKIFISGMAKGSGMIHPNMGTMLSFLTSNVKISKKMLSKALKESVNDSYNMISVDGDTSTNDTVIILANGSAENKTINYENKDYFIFKEALHLANVELAKQIAKDGEGATKLIEVDVINSKSKKDAKICAKSVITSSLVKSAFFGNDANWGRIICSLGYSCADFNPEKVSIFLKNSVGSIHIVNNGRGLDFNEKYAKDILSEDYVNIIINLNDGIFNATAWGCDLTYDYVKINGSYRS